MKETVFEVLAEGGSLSIERKRTRSGEKFIYHHSEMDFTDEGLGVNKEGEYKTFEEAFQFINGKYPWFRLHLEKVHEDYRSYVADELVRTMTYKGVGPKDLGHAQKELERALGIKLEFGLQPIRSGLQNITINLFVGSITEYEYNDFSWDYYGDSVRSDDLKIYKKEESINWNTIICVGTIHVSGSTIIIKNEFDQPVHVFNSDKSYVTATPILSQTKGWFFRNNFSIKPQQY